MLSASDAEVGDEKWARAFAGWHRAVVELRIGDTVEFAGEGKAGWSKRAKRADEWLAGVLAMGEFDLKTRVRPLPPSPRCTSRDQTLTLRPAQLESRVLMLRDEMVMRKSKLGLS